MMWQSMESAPKDGRPIWIAFFHLHFKKMFGVTPLTWDNDKGWVSAYSGEPINKELTEPRLWQPYVIPDLPVD